MTYGLVFDEAALKEWEQLDGSVKAPLKKALAKRLESPHVPSDALRGALAGYYRIKLRKQGYRLIYRVDDKVIVVIVLAVGKRENDAVYVEATTRLTRAIPQSKEKLDVKRAIRKPVKRRVE
ncbi:MAG: type II toxin-antitoxin system mRNA interferase toxin, RelE/StbE family [Betaproteobacteria bacterium]|nr:MAG: type II toxin-antitoxin system mRNA interferase toxin, RelE/StbE family [Betaproteobacteria bacterium]